MKKYILTIILFLNGLCLWAQTYNNEWIDYNNTYYKFSVGANGIYRISQPVLSSAGLGGVQAQNFQLWRNGVEVPVFTSVSSGTMGSSDFIEFYGLMNDGQAETKLYKYDSLQMNSKWSLYTDTSAYFLTVNTISANKRLTDGVNDVAGNSLSPEPYFMHKLSKYFKQMMNAGYGYDLGELVNSASYETAEGWSSYPISSGGKLTDINSAIHLYSSGPAASVSAVVIGNQYTSRIDTIKINGVIVASTAINGYNINKVNSTGIPLSVFTSDAANIEFGNKSTSASDQMIVASYEITYPRTFNFGGTSQFNFELAQSDTGNYLEISNFNYGAGTPVLYDLTNNIRYTAVVGSGLVKFALPSSASARNCILLSTDAAKVVSVNNLTQRNFVNYSDESNQGDYVIISHPILYNDGSGNNNVENYRAYRNSAPGGNYNARIVDIDQLIDQFGFGVKHSPLSIRTFSNFAQANFVVKPKYFFLIGKGLTYEAFRNNESDPNVNKLALIPTFGTPASDNLLTASRTGEYPLISIGRLSAITGAEVGIYLQKMKQFEQAQESTDQTISNKAWTKNVAEVTGGLADPSLNSLITSYMQGYEQICTDTLFGAKVYQFSGNSGSNKAEGTNKTMETLINEGVTLITYFGHSSPNTIEFNLDDPTSYNNTGKYPLMMINGCQSGDLFQFDTLRAISKGSLSEKFIFADQKGSIGYIANTHYGLPTQLNYVNAEFYRNFSKKMYGQSLGDIMRTTMKNVITTYSSDYIAQTHVEEVTLHGDPAIFLNPHNKSDYVIQDSLLTFSPTVISVADEKMTILAKIMNIGKATGDSVKIKIELTTPDNTVKTLFSAKISPLRFEDSIQIVLPLNPLINKGVNQVTVTIDPDNEIPELSELNNTVTKIFTVIEDEIRPVYPYEYSIVNNASPILYGSTASAYAKEKMYVMEMDTSALFTSAGMIHKTILSKGGIIQFTPDMSLTDSTVYYWRVAVGPVSDSTHWLNSSFIYIAGGEDGFNQSHYFQYRNNDYSAISLDSFSRRFFFNTKTSKLLARVGTYPYYSWDQNNVNMDDIQVDSWGCVFNNLQFYVFDSTTLQAWKNSNTGGNGRFGSWPVCTDSRRFFEFPLMQQEYRKRAMNFFDSIPNGSMVLIRNLLWDPNNTSFINTWKADTAVFGSGRSLWHKFHELGLNKIDSFSKNYPFLFVFKKGDSVNYPIYQDIGPNVNNQIINSYFFTGKEIEGTVSSPWFGPAKEWKNFKWDEIDSTPTTEKIFDIIGKDASGNEVLLAEVYNSKDTSISFIDAASYPYLKLRMYNKDEQKAKPAQLKYWMLTGTTVPEGALAPNITYQFQDTVTVNDTLQFRVGFKNISSAAFDSIKVRLTITDRNGVEHVYNNLPDGKKITPLGSNDSAIVYYAVPAKDLFGNNQFFLDVNPDNDQPEQFHFNNVLFKTFFVTVPEGCVSGAAEFYTGNTNEGNTYQWQLNSGSGYNDINEGGIYSGTTADTLLLSSAPTTMYGNKFRCAITNNGNVFYSDEFTLKFADYWTGAVDTLWENPANWSCNTIPDRNTDVYINSGLVNYPVVNSNAFCRSLHLKSGSVVIVNSEYTIEITGTAGN